VQFERNWRRVAWAVMDKSLPLAYGIGFLLLVVRVLPPEEFGLQGIASTLLLTISQLLRFLLLVPLTKYVAEGREPERVAATGMLLYVLASAGTALLLGAARTVWADAFGKPALAAVLLPSASLLLVGSARDAATATLEGHRRLRALFWTDCSYYAVALGALGLWRWGGGAPRTAVAIQWVQAAVAAAGSLLAVAVTHRSLAARPTRREAERIVAFGRYSFGSGLGATLGQQADTLLAGRLMDARGVASYQVAKLFFRVFNVLAQAINQVLMPLVSRLHVAGRQRDVRVLYEKSVCFLHLALLPILAGLVVLAPQLYRLFFGDRYAASIPVFRILVASAATLPFASVGSPFLVGLGRVRSLVWITWLGTGLGIGLALLWIPRLGPTGAALAVLVAAVAGMVARTWVLRRILGFGLVDVAARTRDAVAFARRRLGFSRPPTVP
jgi:O-antigen/teichoic acid export membrane protein